MTTVKICGITTEQEAEYLNEAQKLLTEKNSQKKAQMYAGFVFYEKSKRNVSIEQAEKIFKILNPDIKKVAVTVEPDRVLAGSLTEAGFDILQAHKNLKQEVLDTVSIPVWLAVNLEKAEMLEAADAQLQRDTAKKIQAVLVDAPGYGSGKTFGWENAQDDERTRFLGFRWRMREEKRLFLLAGGLTPENVGDGIRFFDPDIVDVSSGVEGEDGKKSRKRILEFIEHMIES